MIDLDLFFHCQRVIFPVLLLNNGFCLFGSICGTYLFFCVFFLSSRIYPFIPIFNVLFPFPFFSNLNYFYEDFYSDNTFNTHNGFYSGSFPKSIDLISKSARRKKYAKKYLVKRKFRLLLEFLSKTSSISVPSVFLKIIKFNCLKPYRFTSEEQKLIIEFFSKLTKYQIYSRLFSIVRNWNEFLFIRDVLFTKEFCNLLFDSFDLVNL